MDERTTNTPTEQAVDREELAEQMLNRFASPARQTVWRDQVIPAMIAFADSEAARLRATPPVQTQGEG